MQVITADTRSSVHSSVDPFERLFLDEYPRVVAIANRVLADTQEAEDVAQEVFVGFHRMHSPDAPYAAPWLHRAAAHAALNVIRSRSRRARRENLYGETVTSTAPDPAERVEQNETRRMVRSALLRLPERSSTILALRYGGLSYAEVASAVGVNVGQVGTILKRAEAALRREVERGTSE